MKFITLTKSTREDFADGVPPLILTRQFTFPVDWFRGVEDAAYSSKDERYPVRTFLPDEAQSNVVIQTAPTAMAESVPVKETRAEVMAKVKEALHPLVEYKPIDYVPNEDVARLAPLALMPTVYNSRCVRCDKLLQQCECSRRKSPFQHDTTADPVNFTGKAPGAAQ